MLAEPSTKRAIAFIDGQNLFHAAREAFGYTYPNYDPLALAEHVCKASEWQLMQVRLYTGIPDAADEPFWNHFWTAKLAVLGTRRVYTYSRPLRYRNRTVRLPDGTVHTYLAGHEKGIDVRLALDVVGLAVDGAYDVALIFSQDQDLSELGIELRRVARRVGRWIKMACAYPASPTYANRRGISGSDWIRIDRATYDQCIDRNDYRPKGG